MLRRTYMRVSVWPKEPIGPSVQKVAYVERSFVPTDLCVAVDGSLC